MELFAIFIPILAPNAKVLSGAEVSKNSAALHDAIPVAANNAALISLIFFILYLFSQVNSFFVNELVFLFTICKDTDKYQIAKIPALKIPAYSQKFNPHPHGVCL
jgi:hypothetical protein